MKKVRWARVDLGGIAKGYAIDRAAEILRQQEVEMAIVDIGGDVRVFGVASERHALPIQVKNPDGGVLSTFKLSEGGVCTSGDYARPLTIGGKKYSHIIDPRTGLPAARAASVTVVAKSAQTADVWATALSVLGPDGLKQLPAQVQAMLVVPQANGKPKIARTKDFPK